MRYTHIRKISDEDKKELYDTLDIHPEIKYRVKIVLLAGEGYTVPEIREMTNTYDKTTIRKWIHRFNDNGTNGLFTEINYSPMIKITDRTKKEIIRISSTNPRELGLKFSAWSLMRSIIAGYVREKKIVVKEEEDGISHTTTIRGIL